MVEKIHEPFILLSDFIIYNQLHEKKNFEQLIQNHFQLSVFDLRNQLEDFFVKIGKLNQASDFHEENIVYDFNQKKWIYLDWLNSFEENLPSQLNNQKIGINELLDRFGQFKDYQFSITDQKNLKWFEHIINRAIKRIIINRKTNQTKYLCEKVFQ